MGKIFYLMGKSSTGKDTIYKMLKDSFPEMKPIVLYTTRPIREGEQDGREYFFVDETVVDQFTDAGKIIELRAYNTVHGVWKYFTVDDGQIVLDHESYLVIGTLESYDRMRRYFGDEAVVPIYIEVEDGERLTRALNREKDQEIPKYTEMCRRFLADAEDFSEKNLSRSSITKRFQNQDMEICFHEINLYIKENL